MEFWGPVIGAVGVVGAAIVSGVFALILQRKKRQLEESYESRVEEEAEDRVEELIQVFDAPADGSYNKEFYHYFKQKILGARNDIYITGDGFEFSDPDGSDLARSFVESWRTALHENQALNLVRVEMSTGKHPEWARLLSGMLRDFPGRFLFYVIPANKATAITSVCSIDPELPDRNVSEIMLSRQRLRGVDSSAIAGTAIFVEGKKALAKSIRDRILALKGQGLGIEGPEDVERYLVEDQLYFSYASNMDPEQMKSRCSSAEWIGVGLLKDHELVFNRRGTYRDGGVGSVEPAEGERVYGVIWKIDLNDLLRLDEFENLDAYKRETFRVLDLEGESHECHAYQAKPEGEYDPDPVYLRKVIRAAKAAGLPEQYIERLEALQGSGSAETAG